MTRTLLAVLLLVVPSAFARPGPDGAVEPATSFHVSVTGGLSTPVGDFSTSGDGMARPGYSAGIEGELRFGSVIGWMAGFRFTTNRLDPARILADINNDPDVSVATGAWKSYLATTGIRLTAKVAPPISLIAAAQAGFIVGFSPTIDVSGPGGHLHQQSGTAASFAVSVSAGFLLAHIVRLDVQYYRGTPAYSFLMTGELRGRGVSENHAFEQTNSALVFEAGVEF
jgi:hypothetical protein